MARKQKDPLGPLETVVVAALGLTVLLLVVVGVGGLLGGRVSLDGVSSSEVCVSIAPGYIIPWGGTDPEGGGEHPLALRDGVRWGTDRYHVCDESPSTSTVLLGLSRGLLKQLGAIGCLALLWRVIIRGRREGLFSDAIPGDLRRLAFVVLATAAAEWLWSARVDALLLGRLSHDAHGSMAFSPNLPFWSLLIGLGLISLARVMTHAVAMREDVEATV